LTPDERFLAYPKHRSDESQLWLKDLSTGTERHLTTTAPVELNPTIAADGSAIAFTIRENGRFGGRIIAAAGGAVKNVCEDCLLHAWLDTRTIVGLFPSGHPRVRLLDVQTLTTADVFDIDEPINRLIPTSDRRWLAVGARDRTWIVPLQPGSVKTPATAQTIVYEPNDVIPGRLVGWSPDGRLLYSLLGFDGFRCLYAQHVDHGSLVGGPVIVHHFHDPHRLWGSTPLSNAITNRGFVFDQVETAASIWLRDRPQRE
jgi:Tol biopolymer transport system component